MKKSGGQGESRRKRLRWVTLGEFLAIAALAISGLGLWREWSSANRGPSISTVVEKRASIPLTLRGKAVDGGKTLEISPVETSHSLESLTVTIKGVAPIEIGDDGDLGSDSVADVLGKRDKASKGRLSVPATIAARYVEAGVERHSTGAYVLRYRWDGGSLFGGRSLRLIGLSRS